MSSEDGSSLSGSSSDVSSQTSDGCPGSGRHRPVVNKYFKNVNISEVKGVLAFGRNAKIKGVPLCHLRDGRNPGPSSTSLTQPPGISPLEAVDAENDTETPEGDGTVIEVSEDCQGSYCPIDRQHGQKRRKLNARASKGILYNTEDRKFQWSFKTFSENPEKFIQDMDINAAALKEEKEDFILSEILPHLEELWGKCFSSNEKIYEVLARISCSEKSGKVVREALKLLLYLICKDNFDSCDENLLQVEAVSRSSFLSPEGLFKKERNPERELKLYAYSRILSSLVIQQAQKGELPIVNLEQDFKRLQEELKRLGNHLSDKKKDCFRYSIEFIQKAIPCLLKPPDRLKVFLDECQEFCFNKEIGSSELKVLRDLRKPI